MTKRRIAILALLALACAVPGFAQKTKSPTQKAAVAHLDKTADFTKFKTWSYETGQPAINKEVDARIVTAIEAQMEGLGLTKATSGPGDVVVTYYAVTRTDVDLSTFDKEQPAAGAQRKPAQTFKVGTLVVDVKPALKATPAWRAKVEDVLKGDTAAQIKTVDDAVIAAFALYPTRTAKK